MTYSLSVRRLLLCALLLLGVPLVLAACDSGSDEEEDDNEITPEEAVTTLNTSLDGIVSAAEAWEDGATVQQINAIANSGWDASPYIEALVDDASVGSALKCTSALVFRRDGDDDVVGLDFAASEGTYTYDADGEDCGWTRTGSDAGGITLLGPASEEAEAQNTNDASISLTDYEDEAITIDGETLFLPTRMNLDIDVDDTPIFGMRLAGVQYEQDDDLTLPTSFDLTLVTNPYEHRLALTQNSDTEFDVSLSISGDDGIIVGLDATVMLASSDYAQLEEDDLETVALTLTLPDDIIVEGEVQAGELLVLDDPTETDINTFVALEVLYRGAKLGDLTYDDSIEDFLVVYSDGTSDPASTYYEGLLDDLEATFETLVDEVE